MSNKKQDLQRDLKGEGRKKIMDINVSWHTAINVLVFVGLFALTGMETYKCFTRLMEAPTYTSFRLAAQKETDFPSLTICPVVTEAFKDNKLKEHGIEYQEYKDRFWYRSGKGIRWSSRTKNITEAQLFNDITYEFEDIIYKIELRHFATKASKNFERSSTIFNSRNKNIKAVTIAEQRSRNSGRCYTFSPSEDMRKKGISHVSIWFNKNVTVDIHRQDQYLDMGGRMPFTIQTTEHVRLQIFYQEFTALPRIDPTGDITGTKGRMTCSNEIFDDCMYNTLTNLMKNVTKDHCTAPYVFDNKKVCTNKDDIDAAYLVSLRRSTNQGRDCDSPCKSLFSNFGGKTNVAKERKEKSKRKNDKQNKKKKNKKKNQINEEKIDKDLGKLPNLRLHFSQRIQKIEEHYLYTFLNFLAESGGFVGLFLGYSFFNIAAGIVNASEKVTKGKEERNNKVQHLGEVKEINKLREEMDSMRRGMKEIRESLLVKIGHEMKSNVVPIRSTTHVDNDDWDQ